MNSPTAIAILVAAMIVMIAASIQRRRRRPTNEELIKLSRGFVGAATSLFVIVWAWLHLALLEGNGPLIIIGMLPYSWTSLCAGYDAVTEMLAKEIPAAPPETKAASKRDKDHARIVVPPISPSLEQPEEAIEDGDSAARSKKQQLDD